MKQQLTDALADHDRRARNGEWMSDVPAFVAAARLVERLLPGECPDEECVNGWLDPPRILHEACDGSGRVWDEGIVEAVAQGVLDGSIVQDVSWDSNVAKIDRKQVALAVLSALVELLTEKAER